MLIKFVSTIFIIILVLTLNTGSFAQSNGGRRIANSVTRSATKLNLFSFFRENGKDGFYRAYSYEGLSWKPLNHDKALLKPEVGQEKLMRDPCLYQAPDGVFHLFVIRSPRRDGEFR